MRLILPKVSGATNFSACLDLSKVVHYICLKGDIFSGEQSLNYHFWQNHYNLFLFTLLKVRHPVKQNDKAHERF